MITSDALLILDGEDFLDGEVPEFQLKARAAASSFILCTDGAAREAVKRGVVPNAIIGDMDSLTREEQQKMRSLGVEIILESDQNSNDFEKALKYLIRREIKSVDLIAISGGRIDHVLTNFSVLARFADRFEGIRVLQSGSMGTILTVRGGLLSFFPAQPTIYSLVPLPKTGGIVTKGLKYALSNETLEFGQREGLSNVSDSNFVSIVIDSGALLVIEHKAAK